MKKKFWTKRNIILIIIVAIILAAGGYYLYTRKFSMLPDGAAQLLSTVHEPTSADRVLIVSPHFDDETIAAGGYIERAEENKAAVEIAVVTDGNRRKVGAERKQEFTAVTKSLGVAENKLVFLNLPEFYLRERVSQADLSKTLQSQVDNFKPTIIIYPDSYDQNPDHKYIGQTMNDMLANRTDLYAYTYLVHWKYFPQPVGLHTEKHITPPVQLLDFSHNWQRFDLTQGEEDRKQTSLDMYKSQLRYLLLHDLLVSMVRRNELFNERLRPLPNY
ncbi:MAG: PIG-L family deacetylase [Candidatus Berkelbacteria bacterium]|nr:PIG-L family deacetylase [Candidatus Berkelbacteria bacterium]